MTPEQEGRDLKGIIHIAEYFEITYENLHFSPLSLNIHTDLRASKGGFYNPVVCLLHFKAIKTLKMSSRGIDTRRIFNFINGYLVFVKASFIFRTHLVQSWDKLIRIK